MVFQQPIVTSTISSISLTAENITHALAKLKSNTSCSPDEVPPKLFKLANTAIIPSLLSVFKVSAYRNVVPSSYHVENS